MICWANPSASEVREYVRRYWAFQDAFKSASRLLRSGILDVDFPPRAFRPVTYRPPALLATTT